MTYVEVAPGALDRALARAGRKPEELSKRFPKLDEWRNGRRMPTFRQLSAFAQATYTPFGYFFLARWPDEPLPIPDFRTIKDASLRQPGGNLLDTIYAMQRRQDWLREDLTESGAEPCHLVGRASLDDDPARVGQEMRKHIGYRRTEDLSKLRERVGEQGVYVVINGIVGNNTRRRLDVHEFRGFALVDDYAPLIFVNGSDSKTAQRFTIAHELAHVWLGKQGEGVSRAREEDDDSDSGVTPDSHGIEDFCNRAAAEFLVPEQELRQLWRKPRNRDFKTLAKTFKVSPIVIGRRAMDLGCVDRETFFDFYSKYTHERYVESTEDIKTSPGKGGDFYNNLGPRIGKRFMRAVVCAAYEGRLTFGEAYDLTGLSGKTFRNYAEKIGMSVR